MKAVHLNRRLVLEAPERTPDGAGGFAENWVELGSLWAEVQLRAGRERAGALGQVSDVDYKISIRAAPVGSSARPKPGQRFVEGARRYLIEAVAERDTQGRYLVCFAREEVQI